MALTFFLAKLIGLTLVIVSVSILARKTTMVGIVTRMIEDPPLLFLMEMIGLIAGLAMVLSHNVWSGGTLAIVVTLFGWILLIRSIVAMFLSPPMIRKLVGVLDLERTYPIFAIVNLLIGAYLSYEGFLR